MCSRNKGNTKSRIHSISQPVESTVMIDLVSFNPMAIIGMYLDIRNHHFEFNIDLISFNPMVVIGISISGILILNLITPKLFIRGGSSPGFRHLSISYGRKTRVQISVSV
jgi:hypothetical protein